MNDGNCKCFHHGVVKVMLFLVWMSALGFWWATAFKQSFWWMDGNHFFMDVVILSLLILTTRFCGCCGFMTGKCTHDSSCKCGDCGMCK
jgi:hypothetical protein